VTALIRILQGVAGEDFSWSPGEVVELPADEAAKWADGYRAEYVTPPEPAQAAPAPTEKAATRSRGGGRSGRAETRTE
jgi:hypothetical protein